ncbi:pilus assembly protein PilZ [Novosphingobium sp. PC22D]|nr:pilus assembly protein PilZ [Novosphingobium sp. PC22D]
MERLFITREADRKPVEMTAQCRTQNGLRDAGLISDISVNGCCVRTNSLFFRVGTRVVIRPEGLEGLTGIVRWIAGDKAGVQFDHPIYAPVLEHLAQRHAVQAAIRFNNV